MKNWLIAACTLLLLTGCSKYTTPRKVEKRITEGTWKITTFTVDGNSATDVYANYTFAFNENGNVSVNSGSYTGAWVTSLDKNPAILYLSFPPVANLEYLADDWQVKKIEKSRMELKRIDDNHSSTLVFNKIE